MIRVFDYFKASDRAWGSLLYVDMYGIEIKLLHFDLMWKENPKQWDFVFFRINTGEFI